MPQLECLICFDPILKEVKIPECSHSMCLNCAVNWFTKKSQCPLCRIKVSNVYVNIIKCEPSKNDFQIPTQEKTSKTVIKTDIKGQNIKYKENQHFPKSENLNLKFPIEGIKNLNLNEPRKMTLCALINEFWGEAGIYSIDSKNKVIVPSVENDETIESLGLNHFKENLNGIADLVFLVKEQLHSFKNYIFYIDLLDVVLDIDQTNKMYLDGYINDKHYSSNYNLACYIENVFVFLEQLSSNLNLRDFKNIAYLLETVDDVYYNAKLKYNFRKEFLEEDDYDDDYYDFDEFEVYLKNSKMA